MLRTLSQAGDLRSRRVLLRCDLNVPLDGSKITDDGRIRASLSTINYLVEQGARVLVTSHLGRPDSETDSQFSLAPVAERLEELLGQPVIFSSDTVGVQAKAASKLLEDGGVALLENLRFNPSETSKVDSERIEFAQQLASLADVMVSDGFGVVHRKQASVYELAQLIPSYAGSLIEAELEILNRLTQAPERPYTVVLGGSKVSDKLAVIGHLLPKVDCLAIGGGMVFTVLKALGHEVGNSLLELDQVETVRGFLQQAAELGVEIALPTDIIISTGFSADADHEVGFVKSSSIASLCPRTGV